MSADGSTSSEDASVGFVAWGRGVRNGVQLPELDLLDVAPTIASLLGLRLDDDVAGQPVLGILRSAARPPPPGPKRLGGDQDLDQRLRQMRSGRRLGTGEDGSEAR
jgi:arylsulfatase A-like enzyme